MFTDRHQSAIHFLKNVYYTQDFVLILEKMFSLKKILFISPEFVFFGLILIECILFTFISLGNDRKSWKDSPCSTSQSRLLFSRMIAEKSITTSSCSQSLMIQIGGTHRLICIFSRVFVCQYVFFTYLLLHVYWVFLCLLDFMLVFSKFWEAN